MCFIFLNEYIQDYADLKGAGINKEILFYDGKCIKDYVTPEVIYVRLNVSSPPVSTIYRRVHGYQLNRSE